MSKNKTVSSKGESKKNIIEIMDTTLRDGEQTHNVSFSPTEKLHIARILLERVNVSRIEVASARVSDGELNAVKNILNWAHKESKDYAGRVEVLGFVDGKKSIDWILSAGGSTINLLTKGSLKHLQYQLRKKPEEHFKEIEAVRNYAAQKNVTFNVYLEDWSNGYKDSRDYVYQMLDYLVPLEVARIMLPDTLGVMYPEQVYNAMVDLCQRYPQQHFDFHPHNDYGLGTINVLEAIRGGAKGVHTTVNCLGERAGNASLSEVSANIHDQLSLKTSIQEEALYTAAHVVETFSGKRLAHNAPIVGEDVFTQTAGIHADGDKKAGLYENPLMPKRFGRKRSYALGKLAGKASLENNLKELGIELSPENHQKVLERIIQLGDQKKSVTIDDLPFIIADELKLRGERKISFDEVVVTSGIRVSPVCTLNFTYQGEEYRETGSGDGGYDAFMNALRRWAEKIKIKIPHLVDYEVRIPPGGKTSALVECKIVWEVFAKDKKDEKKSNTKKTVTTRGVDSDQTMAAIYATEKMLNIILDNPNGN